jgi:hypothetical protein
MCAVVDSMAGGEWCALGVAGAACVLFGVVVGSVVTAIRQREDDR